MQEAVFPLLDGESRFQRGFYKDKGNSLVYLDGAEESYGFSADIRDFKYSPNGDWVQVMNHELRNIGLEYVSDPCSFVKQHRLGRKLRNSTWDWNDVHDFMEIQKRIAKVASMDIFSLPERIPLKRRDEDIKLVAIDDFEWTH
ncbi:hypothetical protein J4217_04700 [Candidatus Pacearchaeota archaeon]|nr:hypothetical protein [Candidatus Pacearchaeota archaeon]